MPTFFVKFLIVEHNILKILHQNANPQPFHKLTFKCLSFLRLPQNVRHLFIPFETNIYKAILFMVKTETSIVMLDHFFMSRSLYVDWQVACCHIISEDL